MNDGLQLVLILGFFAVLAEVSRRRDRPDRPPGVLWRFWPNTARALSGRNALFLVVAIGITVVLVLTGLDRRLQDWWQAANPLGGSLPWAVLLGGSFWTIIVAWLVLVVGKTRGDRSLRVAGVASVQAVLSGFVVTQVLKVLTGRRGPLDPAHPDRAPFPKVEDAGDFAFDFWNHTHLDGRFFWPSGHTLSSMVLVTALVACYPDRRWIAYVGYPVVLFMAVTMVDGDFHWASDVVAGLLIGWPVGWTIGRVVRREDERRRSDSGAGGPVSGPATPPITPR